MTTILILIYAALAIGAMRMTWAEQRAKGGVSTLFGILGALACAFWPVTVLAAILWSVLPRPAEHKVPSEA